MEKQSEFNKIFLLGAEISKPAMLPDIPTLTNDYFEYIKNKEFSKQIQKLWEITKDYFTERKDLESFMSLIYELEDDRQKKLLKIEKKIYLILFISSFWFCLSSGLSI